MFSPLFLQFQDEFDDLEMWAVILHYRASRLEIHAKGHRMQAGVNVTGTDVSALFCINSDVFISFQQISFMHTPHQFLLMSSPPAKEAVFRAARQQHGSTFAFQ